MADTASIDINASPARVWQEFAEVTRWPEWMGRFHQTELEGEALQVGSKVKTHSWDKENHDSLGHYRDEIEVWEVSGLEPGAMIQMGKQPNHTTYRLYTLPQGTRVTVEAELNSFAARLFKPIASVFTSAQIHLDLNKLKERCEKEP